MKTEIEKVKPSKHKYLRHIAHQLRDIHYQLFLFQSFTNYVQDLMFRGC